MAELQKKVQLDSKIRDKAPYSTLNRENSFKGLSNSPLDWENLTKKKLKTNEISHNCFPRPLIRPKNYLLGLHGQAENQNVGFSTELSLESLLFDLLPKALEVHYLVFLL